MDCMLTFLGGPLDGQTEFRRVCDDWTVLTYETRTHSEVWCHGYVGYRKAGQDRLRMGYVGVHAATTAPGGQAWDVSAGPS